MEQLHLLIFLSFSMLIGSFLSGTIPMAFKLSDSKSRLLALMGSGILVGTALAIIIPEGIDSIYAQPDSQVMNNYSPTPLIGDKSSPGNSNNNDSYNPPIQEPVQTWVIGVSLVAGFVLMLLIDQFSIYQSGGESMAGHNRSTTASNLNTHSYTLANQNDEDFDANSNELDDRNVMDDLETTSETRPIRISQEAAHRVLIPEMNNHSDNNRIDFPHNHYQQSQNIRPSNTKVTPTLGLVIHASADGIALGAAATSSHRHVEMIIFFAIMLHKAPAAFSLVVFLLHRGLKHATIRRHLLAFSLSAPIAALVTYFGLSQSGKEALRRNNATGIAMLFSAGTFLYVATVHVLPELVHNKLLTPKELLFVVGGAFLPILLAQTV